MRAASGGVARPGLVLVRRIDPDPRFAAHHSQQSAVVHGIQQVGRRAGGTAPVVGDRPVREVFVHLARMHRPPRAHEIQERAHVPAARRRPGRGTSARVHQDLHGAGDEAVVHEDVLVDVEPGIATLEITGAVAASRDDVA